jgi:hypothetical protein
VIVAGAAQPYNLTTMALRFQRRIKLMPGVRLNLGLHGAGLSVGPRGLHVGMNRRGMYTSAGIPGTGIYAVHHFHEPGKRYPEVQSNVGPFLSGVLLAVLLMFLIIILANQK